MYHLLQFCVHSLHLSWTLKEPFCMFFFIIVTGITFVSYGFLMGRIPTVIWPLTITRFYLLECPAHPLCYMPLLTYIWVSLSILTWTKTFMWTTSYLVVPQKRCHHYCQQAQGLMSKANFNLRSSSSNSRKLQPLPQRARIRPIITMKLSTCWNCAGTPLQIL